MIRRDPEEVTRFRCTQPSMIVLMCFVCLCVLLGWFACDGLLILLLQSKWLSSKNSSAAASSSDKVHDAHHGYARGDKQVEAARREETVQVKATRVTLRASPDSAKRQDEAEIDLKNQGVIRINNVVQEKAATSLRRHIQERLEMALTQQRECPDRERLLGVMLCSNGRHDLKLDLNEAAVSTALAQAITKIGPLASGLLSPPLELFELGAIIANPGASRQPVHPDTPWSPLPSVLTAFISLQDIDEGMGATAFLPRTHDHGRHHEAYNAQVEEWDRLIGSSDYCSPLLKKGDCVLFDGRLLHYAQECRTRSRVLFYFSLRANGAGASWKGCGFDKPGTLLDEHRGKFFLDTGGNLKRLQYM